MTETKNSVRGMSEKDQAAFRPGFELYILGPDSLPQPGVPQGVVTKYHHLSERIYPGVERDYWLYIPQQPACLMVFQDGASCLGPDVNVATVFDNLIHKGALE